MNVSADHVSEDVLEKYAVGRLSDLERASVEEHLLICPFCCNRLEEADEFVALMKLALMNLPDTAKPAKIKRTRAKAASAR